ncbi:MAG: hypothetical protein ACOY5W_15740 [Pseudomonadota bacterium]
MFERARILCAALLLSTLLGGCGGGGSSSSTAVATADATGVWEGTITQNGVGTYSVTGLITGGQMRFISVDGNALYEGTVSVSGSTLTATTTNYVIDGGIFSTSTLTGTVVTASSISGTFTSSDGGSGNFSLTYDPVTTRGSSLATITANWFVTDGVYSMSIPIDATGAINGADSDGCVYTGQVNIIDPAVNIYGVSLTASVCAAAGAYSGYGSWRTTRA